MLEVRSNKANLKVDSAVGWPVGTRRRSARVDSCSREFGVQGESQYGSTNSFEVILEARVRPTLGVITRKVGVATRESWMYVLNVLTE